MMEENETSDEEIIKQSIQQYKKIFDLMRETDKEKKRKMLDLFRIYNKRILEIQSDLIDMETALKESLGVKRFNELKREYGLMRPKSTKNRTPKNKKQDEAETDEQGN